MIRLSKPSGLAEKYITPFQFLIIFTIDFDANPIYCCIFSRTSFLGSLLTPSTVVNILKILFRSWNYLKYTLVFGSFNNSKMVDEIRSYLMPYSDISSNDSMINLRAPTFAETSGHYTHIVKRSSIAFLLSCVSSWFLAMLTSIWPKIKGND